MTVQQRMKIHMARHNLSQQDFADLAGISQNSVSVTLRGKRPGIALAYKMAKVLGVKPETLMK